MEGTEPSKAILRVGFPLHKPYHTAEDFLHFRYLKMFGDVAGFSSQEAVLLPNGPKKTSLE